MARTSRCSDNGYVDDGICSPPRGRWRGGRSRRHHRVCVERATQNYSLGRYGDSRDGYIGSRGSSRRTELREDLLILDIGRIEARNPGTLFRFEAEWPSLLLARQIISLGHDVYT